MKNYKPTKEEQRLIDDMLDPLSFEKYCGACYNFNDEEQCPFYNKVDYETEWKKIKCNKFFD